MIDVVPALLRRLLSNWMFWRRNDENVVFRGGRAELTDWAGGGHRLVTGARLEQGWLPDDTSQYQLSVWPTWLWAEQVKEELLIMYQLSGSSAYHE